MPARDYAVYTPGVAGTKSDEPDQLLAEVYSAEGSQNIELFDGYLRSRLGLTKLFADALGSAVTGVFQFETLTPTTFYLACTLTDIFELDLTNTKPLYRTPTYATGVVMVTGSSTALYGGRLIDDCDDDPVAWVDDTAGQVTVSRETTVQQENGVSVKLALAAGAGTGLMAHHQLGAAVNVSAEDSIGFWFRSSVALNAGDFKILLDDTGACTSPIESIDLPAITADTWTWVNVAMADPSLCTAILSVGLNQVVDKGACNLYIDFIVSGDWAGQAAALDKFRIGAVNDGTFSIQAWYTVSAVVSDTQITLTAVYAQATAYQQAYTLRLVFAGAADDYWSAQPFTDSVLGRIFVLTNGVDDVVYWTGANQAVVLLAALKGRYLLAMNSFLFLAWCIVSGVNEIHLVRWCAAGNALSWPTASAKYLVETEGEIRGMSRVGNYACIPKEVGFYLGRYVGGDLVFDFELRDASIGNLAPYSLIARDNGVDYLGKDNRFHFWDGVRDIPTSDALLPFTRDLDPDGQLLTYGILLDSRKQIRWFVAVDGVTFTHVLVYNYGATIPNWNIWDYDGSGHLGVPGLVTLIADLYVDDTTWGAYFVDEQIGFWDDRSFLAAAPLPLYGGTDGYLRRVDIGSDDDSTDILSILRTIGMDYGAPTQTKRFHRIQPWLKTQGAGSVTYRMRRDDSSAYGTTKTFSLVEAGKDVTKPTAVLDVAGHVAQHEFRTTDHLELIGFITRVSGRKRRLL